MGVKSNRLYNHSYGHSWDKLTFTTSSIRREGSKTTKIQTVKFRTYLFVRTRLSWLWVNNDMWRCLGRAPSDMANSCILIATSSSPSSIRAFMTRPAPLTIAIDGCCETQKVNLDRERLAVQTWKSLKTTRPLVATISNNWSNKVPSVVSL